MDRALALTLVSWLVVNLPLMRTWLINRKQRVFPQLFNHAPNQFVFLVVCFPVAAYACIRSWEELVSSQIWGASYWPEFLLAGILATSIIAALDFNETTPDYDQFRPDNARWAVQADAAVWAYSRNAAREGRKLKEVLEELRKSARAVIVAGDKALVFRETGIQEDDAIEGMRYLSSVCNAEEREWPWTDTISRVLNAYELAVALLVPLFVIVGSALVAGHAFSAAETVRRPAMWLALSALMLAVFPIARAYNRAEIVMVTGEATSGIISETWGFFGAMLVFGLLASLASSSETNWIAVGAQVGTACLSVASFLLARFVPHRMRHVIGSGAGWGNLVVLIVMLLLCAFAFGVTMRSGAGVAPP